MASQQHPRRLLNSIKGAVIHPGFIDEQCAAHAHTQQVIGAAKSHLLRPCRCPYTDDSGLVGQRLAGRPLLSQAVTIRKNRCGSQLTGRQHGAWRSKLEWSLHGQRQRRLLRTRHDSRCCCESDNAQQLLLQQQLLLLYWCGCLVAANADWKGRPHAILFRTPDRFPIQLTAAVVSLTVWLIPTPIADALRSPSCAGKTQHGHGSSPAVRAACQQ